MALDYGSTRDSGEIANTRRQSSIARLTASLRQSVASAVTTVEEHIDYGTVGGTALNSTCSIIGAGVLALPLATYNASVLWSSIFLVLMGSICAFSVYVISLGCEVTQKNSLSEVFAISVCGPPRKDADEQESWTDEERRIEEGANVRRTRLALLVDFIGILYNFGCLVIYPIVLADSIPVVIGNLFHGKGVFVEHYTWYLISGAVFFVLTCARRMSELKWSSLLGVGTIMFVALCIIIRYADGSHRSDLSNLRYYQGSLSMLKTFSALALALMYHYLVPVFYYELGDRTPKKMMKTVAISIPIVLVTYITVGIMGYFSFGLAVTDSSAGGNVVNNYPQDDTLLNVARFGLFFHFTCVYPVLSVSIRHAIHRVGLTLLGRREEAIDPETVLTVSTPIIVLESFCIVTSTVGTAWAVGDIGPVVDLVGAVCGTALMITVPGTIGVCLFHPTIRFFDENSLNKSMDLDNNAGDDEYHNGTYDRYVAGAGQGNRMLMYYISYSFIFLGVFLGLGGFIVLVTNA